MLPLLLAAAAGAAYFFMSPKAMAANKLRTMGPKQLSANGLNLVKFSEGLRTKAYQDVSGKWTIGYGHLLRSGDGLSSSSVITPAQAETLLRQDVGTAVSGVNGTVRVPLSQGEFDALTDLVYNIGLGNFGTSTLLRLLNAGDYGGARNQFGVWIYSGGKVISGLSARRKREQDLFAT